MLAVKIDELVGRLEVVRRQRDGEHRDFGGQLGLHQTADHGLGDKVMAIDTAIDHQRGAHDGIIASAFCQLLRQKRHFKCARDIPAVERIINLLTVQLLLKTALRLADDVTVPVSFDKGDV
jgi:hypothetical protein